MNRTQLINGTEILNSIEGNETRMQSLEEVTDQLTQIGNYRLDLKLSCGGKNTYAFTQDEIDGMIEFVSQYRSDMIDELEQKLKEL